VTHKRVRMTTVTVKKTIRITYFDYVSVPLVIEHIKRMRPIMLSPVENLTQIKFSTLFHTRHDVMKETLLTHSLTP